MIQSVVATTRLYSPRPITIMGPNRTNYRRRAKKIMNQVKKTKNPSLVLRRTYYSTPTTPFTAGPKAVELVCRFCLRFTPASYSSCEYRDLIYIPSMMIYSAKQATCERSILRASVFVQDLCYHHQLQSQHQILIDDDAQNSEKILQSFLPNLFSTSPL